MRLRRMGWAMLLLPVPLAAARGQRPASRPELRADVISGRISTAQLGVAWNVYGGPYVRPSIAAGFGAARYRGEVRSSARVEALVRFHLDPLRESRTGLYGSGGVGLQYDAFDRWRPRLVAMVGVELPTRTHRAWSLEAGLGGGLRLGVALRWTGAVRP